MIWGSYLPLLSDNNEVEKRPGPCLNLDSADNIGGKDAEGKPRRLEDLLERSQIPWRAGMPSLMEREPTRRAEETPKGDATQAKARSHPK